jgi:hypothetical protein
MKAFASALLAACALLLTQRLAWQRIPMPIPMSRRARASWALPHFVRGLAIGGILVLLLWFLT